MRDILASLAGTTHRFQATIAKIGQDSYQQSTILLTDIHHWQGYAASDHCWCALTDVLRPLCGQVGRRVEFRARVVRYRRLDGSQDFGLDRFEDIRVVKR